MTEIGTAVATNAAIEALRLALAELDEAFGEMEDEVQEKYLAWQKAEAQVGDLEEQRDSIADALRIMEERSKA